MKTNDLSESAESSCRRELLRYALTVALVGALVTMAAASASAAVYYADARGGHPL